MSTFTFSTEVYFDDNTFTQVNVEFRAFTCYRVFLHCSFYLSKKNIAPFPPLARSKCGVYPSASGMILSNTDPWYLRRISA